MESPIEFPDGCDMVSEEIYKDGEFARCHVIELMQADYDSLFTLFGTEAAKK